MREGWPRSGREPTRPQKRTHRSGVGAALLRMTAIHECDNQRSGGVIDAALIGSGREEKLRPHTLTRRAR